MDEGLKQKAYRGAFWEGYLEAHATDCSKEGCELCLLLKKGYENVPKEFPASAKDSL